MPARPAPLTLTLPSWCCPRCKNVLAQLGHGLACDNCSTRYAMVDGIPDLRVSGDSWIDFEEDIQVARELAARQDLSLAQLVRSVYSRRPGWDEGRIALRTRQVLHGANKLRPEVEGWLSEHMKPGRVVLDLGCGGGMLLAAAAGRGIQGLGIDVSMTWLVVAKRMIAESGGEPHLAAALGEALPLSLNSVDAVVSLDVIEHVRDPASYLSEIDRVTRPKGLLALSTPNRFSLTPEPHVFVWGVGWLPRPWQRAYVRWCSGKFYDDTSLLSSFGLHRLLRANTRFTYKIVVPPIASEDIRRFGPIKALIAKCYNAVQAWRVLRWFFLLCGPFFRIVGQKRLP